jgi:hypothetical protein
MTDWESFLRMLQSSLEDRTMKRRVVTVCAVGLAGIGLCALVMTEGRIERLLVEEGIIALTILVLFIVTKPRKPSNPQHPVPSSEPPHLMRGIKSRQSADGF